MVSDTVSVVGVDTVSVHVSVSDTVSVVGVDTVSVVGVDTVSVHVSVHVSVPVNHHLSTTEPETNDDSGANSKVQVQAKNGIRP